MARTFRRNDYDGSGVRSPHADVDGLPFTLTRHAVEQFRARICPALAISHARRELRTLAKTAKRTDHRTWRGGWIWIAVDGAPVRFVVQDDPHGRVCTTVFAPTEEE
jgi:hypothetical protein